MAMRIQDYVTKLLLTQVGFKPGTSYYTALNDCLSMNFSFEQTRADLLAIGYDLPYMTFLSEHDKLQRLIQTIRDASVSIAPSKMGCVV